MSTETAAELRRDAIGLREVLCEPDRIGAVQR
ncbi:hypothetical protein SGRIM119S_06370 [Streptomyces griseorubiginosus]